MRFGLSSPIMSCFYWDVGQGDTPMVFIWVLMGDWYLQPIGAYDTVVLGLKASLTPPTDQVTLPTTSGRRF
jgi:hypothetical protein